MEGHRSSGSVRIRLGASGAEGTERATHDLYSWLRQTDRVRERADIRLRQVPQGGTATMGAVEIIDLALGQGFAALNLALAYASWRTARPSAPTVTLTTRRGSVTVRDASDEEIRRIVALLDGDGPDAHPDEERNEDPGAAPGPDREPGSGSPPAGPGSGVPGGGPRSATDADGAGGTDGAGEGGRGGRGPSGAR